jgi:hypothetical protein
MAEDARQLSARTRPITIRPLWGLLTGIGGCIFGYFMYNYIFGGIFIYNITYYYLI